MGLQAGGGMFSAMSAYQEGVETSRYYKYMASSAEKNAVLAEERGADQVSDIQDVASIDAKINRDKGKAMSATQKVAMASNGVIGGVTAQDITIDTFNTNKMDDLMIRYNADKQSREVKIDTIYKALDFKQSASQYKLASRQAKKTGTMKAMTGLLNTATQVSKTWYMKDKYKTIDTKKGN